MRTIEWKNKALLLIDQTKLPISEEYIHCTDWRQVAQAIKALRVRGAPAIGVAAAYGTLLAAEEVRSHAENIKQFRQQLEAYMDELGQTRPTAINLLWAIKEMKKILHDEAYTTIESLIEALEREACQIEVEDIALCDAIGQAGMTLFPEEKKYKILTHCNTGKLATAGIGTALGVIYKLHEVGKIERVYADETRPLLQGARLTAFELVSHDIPASLITDNMAAYAMQQGLVDAVIVGADRITCKGDVANKIGTYGVAILAKAHHIPFYVAAPFSTFDFSLEDGKDIPIEERSAHEVLSFQGHASAPAHIEVLNPAFDVTPHEFITAIITEEGPIRGNLEEGIKVLRKKVEERKRRC